MQTRSLRHNKQNPSVGTEGFCFIMFPRQKLPIGLRRPHSSRRYSYRSVKALFRWQQALEPVYHTGTVRRIIRHSAVFGVLVGFVLNAVRNNESVFAADCLVIETVKPERIGKFRGYYSPSSGLSPTSLSSADSSSTPEFAS